MTYFNTQQTYGSVTKCLHWLIFLLVSLMMLSGYFMGDITDKTVRWQISNLHKLGGILVLGLMLVRLIWMLINIKPSLPFNTPWWQKIAERLVHFLIYAILILMPMSGLVMSSAAGKAPKLINLSLGLPIAPDKVLAHQFVGIHYWLAIFIIGILSIHILAAFYHHFLKKDHILQRILPIKSAEGLAQENEKE